MDAVAGARDALDGHSSQKDPRDELAARLTAEGAKLARLEDERVATDGSAYSADNGAGQSFVVARLHNECAAQRIVDCGFTGPLSLADPATK